MHLLSTIKQSSVTKKLFGNNFPSVLSTDTGFVSKNGLYEFEKKEMKFISIEISI